MGSSEAPAHQAPLPPAPMPDAARRMETTRLLALARASRGAARRRHQDEVIRLNMRVASEVARRYHHRGIPGEDIDQVAYLGLVKAVRGYDSGLGEDFLSYAVPTLRGEIRRYFRDAGWTVRPPRSVQEIQPRVTDAESDLAQTFGRTPRADEIARHLDVPLTLVRAAQAATGCFVPTSLDAPRPDDTSEVAPLDRLGGPDPAFETTEARLALKPLMSALDERDRRIIELRYFQNRTQSQIGAEVGVTQEQVSRLLAGILLKLRRRLAA
jgi:RNA polymerase sigma-B factor